VHAVQDAQARRLCYTGTNQRKRCLRATQPVHRSYRLASVLDSDLAVGPDGTIYCLYERGSTDGRDIFATQFLTVARFNLEWLSQGKDSLGGPR
jgi:sialidase-1